jgi:Domain of unknown function (DUF4388)
MTALAGTLSDMSMVNLLQIFTVSKKTGILRLLDGDLRGGVYAVGGRVVHAEVLDGDTDKVLSSGEEAFYTIMHWANARFWFTPATEAQPVYPQTISSGNDHLVMEGLRRLDEEEQARSLISIESWVGIDHTPASGANEIRIDRHSWPVLALVCRGVARVGDLADQSGLGELRTLVIVAELVHAGLLQVVSPHALAAVPVPASST